MSAEEAQIDCIVNMPRRAVAGENPPDDGVARALNRIADALFRQAKASERAVALQEEMVANQRQLAQSSAVLERELLHSRRQ